MFSDLSAIKNNLTLDDYEKIIEDLGGVIYKKTESKWVLYTMCHNLETLDGSPKLDFYIDKKIFMCYTQCSHSFDIFGLIKKRFELMGRKNKMYHIIKYIENLVMFNIDNKYIDKSNNWRKILNKYNKYNNVYTEQITYHEDILHRFYDYYYQGWVEEFINIPAMEKFEIKFCTYRNAIIIPVRDISGNLVGIRVRNLNEEVIELGYKYMPLQLIDGTMFNFNSSQNLYGLYQNIENIKKYKKIVLVESEKGVLQAESFFKKNITVAMFGKNLSKYNRDIIISLGIEEVIIAIDKDYIDIDEKYNCFINTVQKIAKQFKGFCTVSYIVDNNSYLDYKQSPTDCGLETWKKLWIERKGE